MHKIVFVQPLAPYQVMIRFSDGVEGQVDLSDLAGKGVFALWNDPAKFAQVSIDPSSHTLIWPGDIDLCPDTLYQDLTGQTIALSPVNQEGSRPQTARLELREPGVVYQAGDYAAPDAETAQRCNALAVREATISKIRQLPDSLVQEVSDFADFLLTRLDDGPAAETVTPAPRPQSKPAASRPAAPH